MKEQTPPILALACLLLAPSLCAAEALEPVLIGIFARDHERTVDWYLKVLDFEVTQEVVREAANSRITFLDNGVLELEVYGHFEPDTAAAPVARDQFGMPGEGFTKLTLETEDLLALDRRLKERGADFVVEIRPSDRKEGSSWLMVSDPDGNLIQIVGATPQ